MEGFSMLTGMVLLFAGAILLPTSQQNLGIIFMSGFWVPYGLYWYIRRVSGPPHPKLPTAPVFTGPLPVAVVVDEDPAPAS